MNGAESIRIYTRPSASAALTRIEDVVACSLKVFDLRVVSLDRMSFELHEIPVDTDIMLALGLQRVLRTSLFPGT
jgi:hypothetical protein